MNTFTAAQVQAFRQDTIGIENQIHLNNAGAALMPKPVIEAIQNHLYLETIRGGYEAAAIANSKITQFYLAVATLINAKPHQIAFASSATDAFNRALTAIPFNKGDVIITSIHDYVSNQLAFLQLQKRYEISVIRARNNDSFVVDEDHVLELIYHHRPRLVAITHIPTYSGVIQPLMKIGALCQTIDTLFMVDACQSVGQVEVDVAAIGCDFMSATFRKFLRGPRGTGFLYVSDRVLHADMAPLCIDLHSANWVETEGFELAADAKRFELWERFYAGMIGAAVAADYAYTIGMPTIETTVQQLAAHLRTRLSQVAGIDMLEKGHPFSSIVTFYPHHASHDKLKKELDRLRVNCSTIWPSSALIEYQQRSIPWAFRWSPHYFNTLDELDQAVNKLSQLL